MGGMKGTILHFGFHTFYYFWITNHIFLKVKILITHAGSTGPAADAADRIARVMTGLGSTVTLRPMSMVTTLKGYSVVVAGSVEHGGSWLPEAIEFVRRNQMVLSRKRFAIYTIFPALDRAKGAEARMVVMQYTAGVRGMVLPLSEGFFSGEMVRREERPPGERSRFKLRLLMALLREGEGRSHTEIEMWAANLHEKLVKMIPGRE